MGVDEVITGSEPVYLNARADDCSATFCERGQRLVRYNGGVYFLTGIYLARVSKGRELYYVLRMQGSNGHRELGK